MSNNAQKWKLNNLHIRFRFLICDVFLFIMHAMQSMKEHTSQKVKQKDKSECRPKNGRTTSEQNNKLKKKNKNKIEIKYQWI